MASGKGQRREKREEVVRGEEVLRARAAESREKTVEVGL